jgi:hypothetical protein
MAPSGMEKVAPKAFQVPQFTPKDYSSFFLAGMSCDMVELYPLKLMDYLLQGHYVARMYRI